MAGTSDLHLLDEDDPTRGLAVSYTGGDSCGPTLVGRSVSLDFVCDSSAVEIPFFAAVTNKDDCSPHLTIPSVHGCPLECARSSSGLVCGGATHGSCKSVGRHTARCFCENGFIGDACDASGSSVDDDLFERQDAIEPQQTTDLAGSSLLRGAFAAAVVAAGAAAVGRRWLQNRNKGPLEQFELVEREQKSSLIHEDQEDDIGNGIF